MESGSFAGAPPAAAEEPTQTTQPTPDPQPTAPPEPAPAVSPQGDNAPEDPVLARLAAIEEKIDKPQGEQAASPAPDLLEALMRDEGAEEESQLTPEQATGQEGVDPQAQRELEELTQFIDTRAEQIAEQRLNPYIQQQQERELRGLQQKYPDITGEKVLPALEKTVQDFVNMTGDEGLKMNPEFVERAYRLVKAELADANGVPAERAATSGASLETNAGSSQAGADEPSTEEQYKSRVYGAPRVDSVLGI